MGDELFLFYTEGKKGELPSSCERDGFLPGKVES